VLALLERFGEVLLSIEPVLCWYRAVCTGRERSAETRSGLKHRRWDRDASSQIPRYAPVSAGCRDMAMRMGMVEWTWVIVENRRELSGDARGAVIVRKHVSRSRTKAVLRTVHVELFGIRSRDRDANSVRSALRGCDARRLEGIGSVK
jgi:hypothetical protein